jgi:Domain of unknown function (DUF4160)
MSIETRTRQSFGLLPVELARSSGFDRRELSRILALLADREAEILEAWNEHFRIER